MKQLCLSASNLLLSLPVGKDGVKPLPMAEIVVSAMEPVYRLVNNQVSRDPILHDFRFTVDLEGLRSLITDLQQTETQLEKLGDHFDETQPKLPI